MTTTKHTPAKPYLAVYSLDNRHGNMTRQRCFSSRAEANAFLRKMYNCGYSIMGVFMRPAAIAKATGNQ